MCRLTHVIPSMPIKDRTIVGTFEKIDKVVTDPKPHQIVVKVLVHEVSASITNHHPRNSESWKYCFFKHLLEFFASAASHGMASTHLET